jgi:predicted nucleic acid-binding protein
MILVDTSIWIRHFRKTNIELSENLVCGRVSIHSMIIGELACGSLPDRKNTLHYFSKLPFASNSLDREVMQFIESHQLMGRGIGYVDAHLLTAAIINNHKLWSADKKLHAIAITFGVGYIETR